MPTSNITDSFVVDPIIIDRSGLEACGIKFSNAWLLSLEAKDQFPRRFSLGSRKCVWLFREIREFVEKRAAERDLSAAERRRLVRSNSLPQQRSGVSSFDTNDEVKPRARRLQPLAGVAK